MEISNTNVKRVEIPANGHNTVSQTSPITNWAYNDGLYTAKLTYM